MRDWSNCLTLAESRLRKAQSELNMLGVLRTDLDQKVRATAEEHLTAALLDLVDALAWVRSRG